MGIMSFLLGVEDLAGTNCERRIEEVCNLPKESTQPYQIKKTTGQKDAHKEKYSKEQIDFIKLHNKELLYTFGYVNDPNPEKQNKTGFFHFENHNEELANEFMGFRKINEESLKAVCHPDYKPNPSYRVNKDGCFNLLDDPAKIQEPSREWAERKLGYKKL